MRLRSDRIVRSRTVDQTAKFCYYKEIETGKMWLEEYDDVTEEKENILRGLRAESGIWNCGLWNQIAVRSEESDHDYSLDLL